MKQSEQFSSMAVGAGLLTQSTMNAVKPMSSMYINKLKSQESPLGQEFIIHRSANCTIYNNYHDELQRKL